MLFICFTFAIIINRDIMDFALNQETKASIRRVTGMTVEEIRDTDSDVLQQRIEKKIGKELRFNKNGERPIGRGSVHIALGRFFTFDRSEMEKRIDSIK
jgi:hypothetical protein